MNRLTLVAAAAAILLAGPPQTVFRSAADAVRVDVLVTDGRRPLGGLTVADFELRDSGILQQIDDVAIAEVPFSVMLALDTSSSMDGEPLRQLRDASRAALAALQPGDRASLVTFGESVSRATPWSGDRTAMRTAIDGLVAGGSTSLFDATLAAIVQRDPEPGRRNLLIVFTDGTDTSSWLPDFAALDLVRRTDLVVYGVRTGEGSSSRIPRLQARSGIRLDPHQPVQSSADFLEELAARTGGESLSSSSDNLRKTFERIVTDFRTRYVLAYTPRNVAASGWHPIEVKVKGRRASVKARRGYQR